MNQLTPHSGSKQRNLLFVLTASCCRSPGKALPESLVWHLNNFCWLGRTNSPDRYHLHFPIADGPLEQEAIRFRTLECLPPQRDVETRGERGSMNLWKKLIQSRRSMAGRSWLPPDTGQVKIPGNSAELEGPGLQEKGVLTRPIMKEEPVHKQEQL